VQGSIRRVRLAYRTPRWRFQTEEAIALFSPQPRASIVTQSSLAEGLAAAQTIAKRVRHQACGCMRALARGLILLPANTERGRRDGGRDKDDCHHASEGFAVHGHRRQRLNISTEPAW
jgi:hypothetical protein